MVQRLAIGEQVSGRPFFRVRPNKPGGVNRDVGCFDNLKLSAVDAKNLPAARYGIITGLGNTITIVVRPAAVWSFLERLDRQGEEIADAVLGLDHASRSRINFMNSCRLQKLARKRPPGLLKKGQ